MIARSIWRNQKNCWNLRNRGTSKCASNSTTFVIQFVAKASSFVISIKVEIFFCISVPWQIFFSDRNNNMLLTYILLYIVTIYMLCHGTCKHIILSCFACQKHPSIHECTLQCINSLSHNSSPTYRRLFSTQISTLQKNFKRQKSFIFVS